MADHPDRFTCGKTGEMYWKLTGDGKRLPVPKQNKQNTAVKEKVVVKAAAKKKGKK